MPEILQRRRSWRNGHSESFAGYDGSARFDGLRRWMTNAFFTILLFPVQIVELKYSEV